MRGAARHAVRDAALAEGAQRRAEGAGGVPAHPARRVRPGRAAPTSTTAPRAPSRPRRRRCRSASAALGAADAGRLAWVAAQDQVWANCGRDRGVRSPQIPAELDASATPQARADRAYQIATASFYAGQWDAAVTRFRAIAADRTSPWQPWGEYLAGRAFLRKGTIGGAGGASIRRPGRRCGRVRAGRRGSGVAAAHVGGRPRAVHRPAAAPRRAARSRWPRSCSRPMPARRSTTISTNTATCSCATSRPRTPRCASGRGAADPLTDWIDTLRSDSPDALGHAIARWKAQKMRRERMPWLVAAMLRLTPGHADEAALVAAARAVPASSPAYPSLAFHRARLLIREGKLDEARALAAEMAKASAAWPPSAVNQLRAVQLRLATSFDGFLAAAVQQPVGFASDDDEGPGLSPAGPAAEQRRARHRQRAAAAVAADRRRGEHGMARAPARGSPSGGADARVAPRRQGCGAPCRRRRPQGVSGPGRGISTPWRPRRRGRSAASWSRCCSPRRPGLRPFMTGGQRRSPDRLERGAADGHAGRAR